MPDRPNPVDPPDYAAWPTLKRLLGLWREQWRLGALGLVCAFAYTLISITVPILVARAIDHAIVRRTQPLWPYVAAIVSLITIMLCGYIARYQPKVIRKHPRAIAIASLMLLMLLIAQLAGVGSSPMYVLT